jgi:hypothetical protein
MTTTRRGLGQVTAAALATIAIAPSLPATAQSADETALSAAIENLRLGTMNADKAKLEAVTAPELSYGHSAGKIENRAEFIEAVMTRKSVVKWLKFTEPKNAIHGSTAIARHFYESESELEGKATTIKIGILQVWQKQDGQWKLFARQAYKL